MSLKDRLKALSAKHGGYAVAFVTKAGWYGLGKPAEDEFNYLQSWGTGRMLFVCDPAFAMVFSQRDAECVQRRLNAKPATTATWSPLYLHQIVAVEFPVNAKLPQTAVVTKATPQLTDSRGCTPAVTSTAGVLQSRPVCKGVRPVLKRMVGSV